MPVLSRSIVGLSWFFLLTLCIYYAPNLCPDVVFEDIALDPPPALEGVLITNRELHGMDQWLSGLVRGPESVAVWQESVYTGVVGGLIMRVDKANVAVPVAHLATDDDRDGYVLRRGRPLGLRFDLQGSLYVADAYLGVMKVNVSSGDVERVFIAGTRLNELPTLIINDLDIGDDGYIYFTSSSSVCDLHDSFIELMSNGSGRLLQMNMQSGEVSELLTGLKFANGVALSQDRNSLLVAETGAAKIHRVWIRGARRGESEVLLSNLPGYPDNIRKTSDGGFYVGLCHLRKDTQFLEGIRRRGWLSRLLIRLVHLLLYPVKLVQRIYPNVYTSSLIYETVTLEGLSHAMRAGKTTYGAALELSRDGTILRALYTDQLTCISQVTVSDHPEANSVFVSSPYSNFIGYKDLTGN